MSVAILRSSEPAAAAARASVPPQRANGRVDLSFTKGGASTALAGLDQRSPCRVLFPRPAPGEAPLAVLVNVSGGLLGGDKMSIAVQAGGGASATVTTQAAEKVYRSLGPDAQIETRLGVEDGARLEWLPQETILFDGACLDRSFVAAVAEGGCLLACEMLVFGRAARGETMTRGRIRDAWRIEIAGRLAWIDRLGLSGRIVDRLDGPGFGGARALATAIYTGEDSSALLKTARDVVELEGGGATLVNGVLVARLLGAEPGRVREGLTRVIGALRRAAFGAGAPALWAI